MTDRIETSIVIEAPLDRVWDLVTEPGWWIPADAIDTIDRTPGSITVRDSEKWGRYPVEVVSLDPKSYAAFRWASAFPSETPVEGKATLVEFRLVPQAQAVQVSVVESGFASLDVSPEARQKEIDGNTNGWAEELASLKRRSEQA